MSRSPHFTSPRSWSFAALLCVGILTLAAPVSARTAQPVSAPAPGIPRFPLCSNVLQTRAGGSLWTAPSTDAEIFVAGGLWVGAEVDRGLGIEQIVTEAAWVPEFSPVDPEQLPGAAGGSRIFYADTSTAVVPHEPLGIRVMQTTAVRQRPGYGGYIRLAFDVSNISAVYQPPGWDLEHVYFGLFADPDIGDGSAGLYWMDDLGDFAATADGDLAWVEDAPGYGDDTAARLGILLPGQEAHVFQVWTYLSDPPDDAVRYALLRGDSHDTRTIEPPSDFPSDQRILVSVGPFSIARGASLRFDVALVCGDVLPPTVRDVAPGGTASGSAAALVSPNPVSRSAPLVRFASLPDGAKVSVYETSGRLMTTLTAGTSGEVAWDLASGGTRVPAGVYMYRVEGAAGVRTGKIVVIR